MAKGIIIATKLASTFNGGRYYTCHKISIISMVDSIIFVTKLASTFNAGRYYTYLLMVGSTCIMSIIKLAPTSVVDGNVTIIKLALTFNRIQYHVFHIDSINF